MLCPPAGASLSLTYAVEASSPDACGCEKIIDGVTKEIFCSLCFIALTECLEHEFTSNLEKTFEKPSNVIIGVGCLKHKEERKYMEPRKGNAKES
jgi:hypothetical protein